MEPNGKCHLMGRRHIPDDRTWIAALYKQSSPSRPCASAALVTETHLLTAGHAVLERDEEYFVTFPFSELLDVQNAQFAVSGVTQAKHDVDIATLTLADPVPDSVAPARIRAVQPAALAGDFWTYGYANQLGESAAGMFGDPLARGMVRLDTTSRYVLEPGFSGAGVWSTEMAAVVAVVVQVTPDGTRHPGDGRAVGIVQVCGSLPEGAIREAISTRCLEQGAPNHQRNGSPVSDPETVADSTVSQPAHAVRAELKGGVSPIVDLDAEDIAAAASIAQASGRSQVVFEFHEMRGTVAPDGSLHYRIAESSLPVIYGTTCHPGLVGVWQWENAEEYEYVCLNADGSVDGRLQLFGGWSALKLVGRWWFLETSGSIGTSVTIILPAEATGAEPWFFEWEMPIQLVSCETDTFEVAVPGIAEESGANVRLTRSGPIPW